MGCFSLKFLGKACNVGSDSRIKVLTVEGRCLKYVAPMTVKEILIDYPQHSLFDAETVHKQGNRSRPLPGNRSLQGGHFYLLIPQLPGEEAIPHCNSKIKHDPTGTNTWNPTSLPSASAPKCSTRTRKVSFVEAHSGVLISDSGQKISMPDETSDSGAVAIMEHMAQRDKSCVQILPSPCEGVIRLKMVVSKKQLAGMLSDGGDGVAVVEGLLSPLLLQASRSDEQSTAPSSCMHLSSRPSPQRIPEQRDDHEGRYLDVLQVCV